MIFPAVVEKLDAAVDGFVNEADGVVDCFGVAQVMAAHAERGDFDAVAAQRSLGNGACAAGVFRDGRRITISRWVFGDRSASGIGGGGDTASADRRAGAEGSQLAEKPAPAGIVAGF